MLEIPDLFERHMTLGQQAFENMNYESARQHFEEAYDIKDEAIANLGWVKSLVALKEYKEAYQLVAEKKAYYEQHEAYQETYFQVLLSLTYFFDIDKLISSMGEKVPEDWFKAYEITKEYTLLMEKERLVKLELELSDLGKYSAIEQGQLLKQIKYLPKEKVVPIVKRLLLDKKVASFTRTEIIQQLIRIRYDEEVFLLTWEGKEKKCRPKELSLLKQVYQKNTVLKEISEYFSIHNPTLSLEVVKTIQLHLGCVYPFQDEVMIPTDKWVASYLILYENVGKQNGLEEILKIQKSLDEEVIKLMSFQ